MPKIILNNFHGLAPDWYTKPGETTLRKGGGIYASYIDSVNPFVNNGYLQAGYNFSYPTSPPAEQIYNTVVARSGSADMLFAFGGTRVEKYTDNNFTTRVIDANFPRTLSNVNTSYINDGIVTWLKISGSWELHLLYAYNLSTTAGAGRVARFDITSSTWDSDTQYSLSTNDTPDPGNSGSLYCDRTSILAPNGMIYWAAGSVIDGLDTTAADATMQLAVLDIDHNFRIRSFGWFRNNLVIFAQQASGQGTIHGRIRAYLWDTFSPSWNFSYDIDDSTVGACFYDNDELFVTTSDYSVGKIRAFNGLEFEAIQDIPPVIPRPSGVCQVRNGFAFGAGDYSGAVWPGTIFVYASTKAGQSRELWPIAKGPLNGTIYSVKRHLRDERILHITSAASDSNYLRYVNTSARLTGIYRWPIIELPHRSTVSRWAIYSSTLVSGDSVALKYASNYATHDSSGTYKTYSYATDGAIRRRVYEINKPDIWAFSPALEITGTVTVARTEIDYELNPNASAS